MWVDGRFGPSVCEPINPRTLVHHYCRQIEVNGGGHVDEGIRAAGTVGGKNGGFDRILEGSVIVGWRDRQEGLEANDPCVFLADELSGFVVQADGGTVDEGRPCHENSGAVQGGEAVQESGLGTVVLNGLSVRSLG